MFLSADDPSFPAERGGLTGECLDGLLRIIQDPVLVLRPDRVVLDANGALLAAVGLTREEVIGRKCHEISHHEGSRCMDSHRECPVDQVLRGEPSAHVLHEHCAGVAGTCFYDVVAYPVRNPAGEVGLILEVWRDISLVLERELEEKEHKIKEDLARLVHEDKLISLGKMVASAVHEINNPIAAIHMFAKVMLRMVTEAEAGKGMSAEELEEMRGYLDLVGKESRRCGDIVGNLLSFSRQPPGVVRKIDLNEMIDRIVLLLHHEMELQKIRLEVETFPELPYVVGHLNQIQQSIMNVVFNAEEAMPEGGGLTIRTGFDPAEDSVVVEIEDTGCGIPEENRSSIFEPFFTTKEHHRGVGLGLSVVYGIIKNHRGSIRFESEVGKGTLFRIAFPAARDEGPDR